MSRFFSDKYSALTPYQPGEQPRDMKYIKLNTNESPFPPSPNVLLAVSAVVNSLNLYSDPELKELRKSIAALCGVKESNIILTNGSDEVLNFAFMAFADEKTPLAFPDITYGFYPVFAKLNNIPYIEIPLSEDFTVNPKDYIGLGKTIVIANPNAPTGLCLSLSDIEEILKGNPDNLVIIDEAYVDFGAESAIKLISEYDNLLVTRTFSKSRSMAGARLGFGIADEKIIKDLDTLRFSTNPYNVNSMTSAAGVAATENNDYYMKNCREIMRVRKMVSERLSEYGFTVLPSVANFLFIKSDKVGGEELYKELKKRGILVRHLKGKRIEDYNRVTIGKEEDMLIFLKTIKEITEEKNENK